MWLLRVVSYYCQIFLINEMRLSFNFRAAADRWWIWFLLSEQLLDKSDNFTAQAILNLIPLNGKQGTLQNVADIYGGRPMSARGRKSRNKEEEVCLPHVCHFHHKSSPVLSFTVPFFPAWFIIVTQWKDFINS